jgi:formylglycine-generating enzyme required for sulfatase activity
MGGDNEQAREDELPKHTVTINSFWIDETEVTNAQFKKFVEATHYITTAEKDFDFEDANGKKVHQKAGSLVFKKLKKNQAANPNTWWQFVEGANWKHPQGPKSTIDGKDNFPVVHVSWNDAQAYAKYYGKRLPTEAEWEFAARGGLKNNLYPWGNEPVNEGNQKCNIWNGNFPFENSLLDKYERSAPVKSFPPNNFGLYDMAGNVWEWCYDTYDANTYTFWKSKNFTKGNSLLDLHESLPLNGEMEKAMRGGSFLCNDSYCAGFRVSARMQSTPETSLEHTGFRCVKDVAVK